jgi:hypothetical protein
MASSVLAYSLFRDYGCVTYELDSFCFATIFEELNRFYLCCDPRENAGSFRVFHPITRKIQNRARWGPRACASRTPQDDEG